MHGNTRKTAIFLLAISLVCLFGWKIGNAAEDMTVTETGCTVEKLGSSIPVSGIGEPVSGVTLKAPVWTAASGSNPAYCSVDGSMTPVSREATARPINFRVILPATWSRRTAQLGGGGMNGMIPNLLGGVDMGSGPSLIQRGFVTYGIDSGHQMSFGFGRGRPGAPGGLEVREERRRPVQETVGR